MNKIEGRHSDETETEDDRIDRQRGELLEKQRRLEEDGIESVAGSELMRSRKTKKTTTSPPSQEMIEHIQSSRAAMKALKTRQRMERREFVNKMTTLERMVLQHLLGKKLTLSQRIELGLQNNDGYILLHSCSTYLPTSRVIRTLMSLPSPRAEAHPPVEIDQDL